jgi:hypothetical protein
MKSPTGISPHPISSSVSERRIGMVLKGEKQRLQPIGMDVSADNYGKILFQHLSFIAIIKNELVTRN